MSQKVTDSKLVIDRQMYWVECGCGAKAWHCERQDPARCPGCRTVFGLAPLAEEYNGKKGKA